VIDLRTLKGDVTDGFCGGGGSAEGAKCAGLHTRIALNHSPYAIEVHNANHPTTDHDCADISQVDPRRYPTTTFAWFSPECTNHSVAKGRRRGADATPDLFGEVLPDELAERSRATMWDAVRFAEHHRYRALIVENVVDVLRWVLWPAWIAAWQNLGYRYRVVCLNSMHATALGDGAPQSRDRVYIVLWREGERAPDFDKWLRPKAECGAHGRVRAVQAWKNPDRRWGKYRAQYVWRCPVARCHTELHPRVRPALDALDLTLPAPRIGDRARPLAEKTMRRIRDGFATYSRPILVPVEGREGKTARPADLPLRACTTRNETGFAVPPYMIELRGGGSKHRPVSEPLATVCASGNHHGFVASPDLVVPYYGNGTARPADEPIPTVTTVDRHALLKGGTVAAVEDLGFRMLEPHEYAAAMTFPATYIWFGSKRARVRLAGNAVTPPSARDLWAMVAEGVLGVEYELAVAA
jgi:DNA (cytosine-5)-methyltransferase 1